MKSKAHKEFVQRYVVMPDVRAKSIPARRPKVIRKVLKFDRNNRAKAVKDYRLKVTIVRVRTSASHIKCNYDLCPDGGHLPFGEERIEVVTSMREGGYRQNWPVVYHYHRECLPAEYRPMLRFFKEKA